MDAEADACYNAERCLHLQGYPSNLTDPQAYFDEITNSKWFLARWEWVTAMEIVVKQTKHACAWSLFDKGWIYLPPWASSDLVLLHEIAHFTNISTVEHDMTFRRNYLLLVKHNMGSEAHYRLRHAFLAFGLDV
jgi:putative metallohydrolase (TIGR04338 family)